MNDDTVRTWLPELPPETTHGLVLLDGHEQPLRHPELTTRNRRAGRCYEMATLWAWEHQLRLTNAQLNRASIQVVHGSIQGGPHPRMGHAWVTFRTHGIRFAHDVGYLQVMSEATWTRWANARTAVSYSPQTVLQLAYDSGHYGPWHARPFGIEDCPHGEEPDACEHGCTADTLIG